MDERRIHARIETELHCSIRTDVGSTDGTIRDISRGGALLEAMPGLARLGDSLEVDIDVPGVDVPITVLGEVVRLIGESQYGLRFSLVEPKQKEVLGAFLSQLAEGSGIGRRQSPRVYRRVEVTCHSEPQMLAVMSNISEGGLALTSDVPLVLDEEITVGVNIPGFSQSLELTGRVVHVRSTGDGQYTAGVRFDGLSRAQHEILSELIRFLLHQERPNG